MPETVKSSEKKAEKEAKQDADKKADKKSDKSKETEKSEKKKESDKKAEKKVEEKVDKVETSTTKKSAEKPTKKEKEQAKPAKSTTDASESKKTKSKDQPKDKQATKDVWEGVSGRQHVHFLNDATFEEFVNTKRKVLVLFYNSKAASKKGQQQELYEAYGKAATEVTSFVPGSYLAAVDTVNSKKLAASFKAQAYPALKYFENADYKFDYKYKSTKEDFVDFMREPNVEKYRKSELWLSYHFWNAINWLSVSYQYIPTCSWFYCYLYLLFFISSALDSLFSIYYLFLLFCFVIFLDDIVSFCKCRVVVTTYPNVKDK